RPSRRRRRCAARRSRSPAPLMRRYPLVVRVTTPRSLAMRLPLHRKHRMHDIDGRPTIAEVSLGALRANCREVCALVGGAVTVMAVVKADAYGHGAAAAARAFQQGGAKTLGVSTVAEGAELRRAGVGGAIVVLGGVFHGEGKTVVEHDL